MDNGKCKIEKGIPIPPRAAKGGGGGPSRFPFNEMGVGDSFIVPYEGGSGLRVQSNVLSSTYHHKGCKGKAFTTRILPDGVRVWRIE